MSKKTTDKEMIIKCKYAHYKNTHMAERYDWDHETNDRHCSNVICKENMTFDQVVKEANKSPITFFKESMAQLKGIMDDQEDKSDIVHQS